MISKSYETSARNKKINLFIRHHIVVDYKHIIFMVYNVGVIYKLQQKTNTILFFNIHQNQCLVISKSSNPKLNLNKIIIPKQKI